MGSFHLLLCGMQLNAICQSYLGHIPSPKPLYVVTRFVCNSDLNYSLHSLLDSLYIIVDFVKFKLMCDRICLLWYIGARVLSHISNTIFPYGRLLSSKCPPYFPFIANHVPGKYLSVFHSSSATFPDCHINKFKTMKPY